MDRSREERLVYKSWTQRPSWFRDTKEISYCVNDSSGKVYAEGWIPAAHFDLDRWIKTLPQPWSAAMEATMFFGWIDDHLKPHATELKAAHPLMLRAIAAAKKKNDRIDANKICDCLRCDFLPERQKEVRESNLCRRSTLSLLRRVWRNDLYCRADCWPTYGGWKGKLGRNFQVSFPTTIGICRPASKWAG
jgi:hypothetical protein